MKEVTGNIWDYHKQGKRVAISSNGTVKKNGWAVMGRGVAWEAAQLFPSIPYLLGKALLTKGNYVHFFSEHNLYTFPVKHYWYEKADIKLIKFSAKQLRDLSEGEVYLVRPGCGNGQLKWDDVREVIAPILRDDRFIVVDVGGDKG